MRVGYSCSSEYCHPVNISVNVDNVPLASHTLSMCSIQILPCVRRIYSYPTTFSENKDFLVERISGVGFADEGTEVETILRYAMLFSTLIAKCHQ